MKLLQTSLLFAAVWALSAFTYPFVTSSLVESVSLEELFTNRDKYADKEIEVTGKCVKINKAIMGRNWVHLQDGTGGDKPYDLTVTTSADVPVGKVVTMRGKITLNKDFGSGYKYDVIMEGAKVVE